MLISNSAPSMAHLSSDLLSNVEIPHRTWIFQVPLAFKCALHTPAHLSKWLLGKNVRRRECQRNHRHGLNVKLNFYRSCGKTGEETCRSSRSAAYSLPCSPSRHLSPASCPLQPPFLHSCPGSGSFYNQSISSIPSQPIIIGDSASDSLLWSLPILLWTSARVI